ncbi:tetratricopeptide repeat protein [Pseudomonas sp. GD03944]|uniref:tetratricopeptide repeat protein n=1 Tax=Pseudomonas sp. GD03944 TaxID=2975409 RepID=UPI0024486ACA|nr:tetratricopeptide repeat protein [Pseudomonas sp. GD03944]MDH1265547.1 tetratricopeptide repeat protein [Pseudomonas sp. GD03944]
MTKWLIPVLTASVLLGGCASVPRGSIPVVDSGTSASDRRDQAAGNNTGYNAPAAQPQAMPEDSGVVVMVPGGGSATPIQTFPAGSAPSSGGLTFDEPLSSGPSVSQPANVGAYSTPSAPSMPSGIPSSGGLAADEQLDGPVLALLTTAQQQQGGGDLNGAASSLERAQRIAPREPQVLYRLAEVRLAQGDAAQAEQFARRGLSYASGRPTLQASLWNLIAQARERQGDAAGAAQAREQARVNL